MDILLTYCFILPFNILPQKSPINKRFLYDSSATRISSSIEYCKVYKT